VHVEGHTFTGVATDQCLGYAIFVASRLQSIIVLDHKGDTRNAGLYALIIVGLATITLISTVINEPTPFESARIHLTLQLPRQSRLSEGMLQSAQFQTTAPTSATRA
jgi:hypothetical protein